MQIPNVADIERKDRDMKLTIHTPDTAPEASRQVMASINDELGFVPNLAATAAGSPALLRSFDSLRKAAGSTGLDPVDREIAGLATGLAADNHYGIAFHSTILSNLGVDAEEIERMRKGTAPSDGRNAAVFDFATELARNRGAVDDEVVTQLERNGIDDSGVLDLVAECVFATLVGVVDNLAGHVELDEFLRPFAWDG